MRPENIEKLRNRELRNEDRPFGFAIIAPGLISEMDARIWIDDLYQLVTRSGRTTFGLLVDIRRQRANPPGATALIQQAMRWLREAGCVRSAVVLDNSMALIQIRRLAAETGVDAYERYINAVATPDWERKAEDWIVRGIEPDQPTT